MKRRGCRCSVLHNSLRLQSGHCFKWHTPIINHSVSLSLYWSIMSPIVSVSPLDLQCRYWSWLHLHYCDDCRFTFKTTFREQHSSKIARSCAFHSLTVMRHCGSHAAMKRHRVGSLCRYFYSKRYLDSYIRHFWTREVWETWTQNELN